MGLYDKIKNKVFPSFAFTSKSSTYSTSSLDIIHFLNDGTYLLFDDKFIEIRPSGTEPLVRVMAEAAEPQSRSGCPPASPRRFPSGAP